jgi:hypothetical protein
MKIIECNRETELVEAICTGRWPEGCDEELRRHAAACSVCADAVEVARAFQDDQAVASQEVRVPSAGLVWWRAELRARREAMRVAETPLKLFHAFGVACGTGVLAALVVQFFPSIREFTMIMVQQYLPVALMLGLLLLLAPVALYFVFSDK